MDSQTQQLVAQSLYKVRGQAGKHLFWPRHPATVDRGRSPGTRARCDELASSGLVFTSRPSRGKTEEA